MDTIYRVTVEFTGLHTRMVETKQFYFTSKDSEVDFVSSIVHSPTDTLVERTDIPAFGRGDFMLALNDLEISKTLPIRA